jgi:hypothetical protein
VCKESGGPTRHARPLAAFTWPDRRQRSFVGEIGAADDDRNIRMGNRRMTRLTNAFSKKAENHAHMMAIYFMHYNFVRIHQTLKIAPAMAAGVTSKLWEMADMVKVLEDWEAAIDSKGGLMKVAAFTFQAKYRSFGELSIVG